MQCFAHDFNFSQFFQCGFATNQLNSKLSDHLLRIAREQPYIESDGIYGTGLVAPVTTRWKSPFLPSRFTDETPKLIEMIGDEILHSDTFDWFRRHFGRFSQTSYMINRYKENTGMVWHNDNFDSTFCSILVYVTGDRFNPEDGGYIEFGAIDDYSLLKEARVETDTHRVTPLQAVLPNHGVAVLINNLNPFFLHRVEKMIVPKERYTFLSHFGYVENTCQVQRRIVT